MSQVAVRGAPGAPGAPGFAALTRAAREHATSRRFPEALALLERCLGAPAAERPPARAECLHEGQRTVDQAFAFYQARGRYLSDLESFGGYPGGRDPHGNDKTFIRDRARRIVAEIHDQRFHAPLALLRGTALVAKAAALLRDQARLLVSLRLHQGSDPDRGPIRTYRYAQALAQLFPRSALAAEAGFHLLSEREELRFIREGNREYPWFGLQRQQDLEGYLGRFPMGPWAVRARFELAAILYDLWLLSRPAFQRTDDFQGYLKVGGAPLDAARGEALRRRALELYQVTLPRLAQIRTTYRPGEDPRWTIGRALRQAAQLRQLTPPADAFPATLFPPG